jgi:hypothetical protein
MRRWIEPVDQIVAGTSDSALAASLPVMMFIAVEPLLIETMSHGNRWRVRMRSARCRDDELFDALGRGCQIRLPRRHKKPTR